MVSIIPYINMPNARKAIELYQKMFDAKLINHQPFTKEMSTPGRFPEGYDFSTTTLHAELDILGQKLYLSDSQTNLSPMGMVDILLEFDNEEQIRKVFDKAKELGSKINMDLNKTFWNAWYANIKDPLGINWQLNYQIPEKTTPSQKNAKPKSSTKESMKKGKKTVKSDTSKKKTAKKSTRKKKIETE